MQSPRPFRVLFLLALAKRLAGKRTLALAVLVSTIVTGLLQAQTFNESVLYSFTGSPDGSGPVGDLVRDAQGNLYGTTAGGGTFNTGAIFKLDACGTETIAYSFTGNNGDGAAPTAGLVLDGQGNLYGTTVAGGGAAGEGTIFRFNLTTGKQTVLYRFTGKVDGGRPLAGLIRDTKGVLYGTTSQGGNLNDCSKLGCGTVFKVTITGTKSVETVLYAFTGQAGDGEMPIARLLLDAHGNFYGTTRGGGEFNGGTVFKLDTTGKQTILHSFAEGSDGAEPQGGLVMDSKGNLYGTTTYFGGTGCLGGGFGCGTVFKVDNAGTESVFYTFAGYPSDGANPCADLIIDPQGNLYGTTEYGGDSNWGTAFKVNTSGRETLLYSFTEGILGGGPKAGLTRDSHGNLYGANSGGAQEDYNGFIFELTPP